MRYVAVDIGCIECDEESMVLGVFDRAEDAQAVANECKIEQEKHWIGEHHFFVFPVAQDNSLCGIPHYADYDALTKRMCELGIEVDDERPNL